MKKALLVFLTFIFISVPAFAEKVRVYTDYTPVRILKLADEKADFDLEASKAGLKGSFKEIEDSDIPQDRIYRESWKMESGKIAEDKTIKEEIKSKKLKKENNKKSAIQKLKASGLTDDELEIFIPGGK